MGIIYRIDRQTGISYVIWDGVVTAEVFIAQTRRLVLDPDWPDCRRVHLVDVLSATMDASVDEETITEVMRIYAENHQKLKNTKVAVAASELFMNAVHFERMMAGSPVSFIVFNSLETACLWLGIDSFKARAILQELRTALRKGEGS